MLMFAGGWIICKTAMFVDDHKQAKIKKMAKEMEEVKEVLVGTAVVSEDVKNASKNRSSGLQDHTIDSFGTRETNPEIRV